MINPVPPIYGASNFKQFVSNTNKPPIKYCFVDFDGTIRESGKEGFAPIRVEDIHIFPWAPQRLQEAKDKGYFIVGVTNQAYWSRVRGTEIVKQMCDATLEKAGMWFPVLFAQNKEQSKPSPWMFIQAEKMFGKADKPNSVMIGDDLVKDAGAAANFGIQFIPVNEWQLKGVP